MIGWSKRRQITLVSGALFAFLLLFVLPAYLLMRTRPTCTDGVQNGTENGIDCGGGCRYLCVGDAEAPLVQFARAVIVDNGVYGAVAYLENRNQHAGARAVPYVLKTYDAGGLLVGEKSGTAYIPPRKVFALFEGRMQTGDRIPVRATFSWSATPRFERMNVEPVLDVREKHFETAIDVSRLEATLYNPSLASVRGIEITALLFDHGGTVYAASRTHITELAGTASTPLSFTWPRLLAQPARIEVLYTVPGQ
jgi:hypothetical protein